LSAYDRFSEGLAAHHRDQARQHGQAVGSEHHADVVALGLAAIAFQNGTPTAAGSSVTKLE
jgi:hypothetical protein